MSSWVFKKKILVYSLHTERLAHPEICSSSSAESERMAVKSPDLPWIVPYFDLCVFSDAVERRFWSASLSFTQNLLNELDHLQCALSAPWQIVSGVQDSSYVCLSNYFCAPKTWSFCILCLQQTREMALVSASSSVLRRMQVMRRNCSSTTLPLVRAELHLP